ncbi:MAG: glycosyltransferase family 2 protein [Chthoniobacterales bacterium]
MPLPLSIAIISYNEERTIDRCLKSVAALAQEIVVVDSGSSDRTLSIAENFGAIIKKQPWLGFRDQKNCALDLCSQPWILALDCDEEVSVELKKSITDFFESGDAQRFSGAEFNRKVFFLGRWILHGDWYPDRKLRLFRREHARWVHPIHETVALQGLKRTLPGDLLHYSFPSMNSYINKINLFTDEFIKRDDQKNRKWSLFRNLSRPLWRFFRAYVLRCGFLDGFPGLWIAVATAFSVFVRYSRSYEKKWFA